MATEITNEFQLNATPGEELSRHLAYLASQDNGFERDSNGSARQQAASALEFLAQQERIRQEQIAHLTGRFDAIEQAARDALIDAENNLAETLSNANRAIDGRAVFKDRNGQVRDQDGEIVDASSLDLTNWDSDAPSWETYDRGVQDVQRLTEFHGRVVDAGSQLNSGDLDGDQLNAIGSELDALEAELAAHQEWQHETPEISTSAAEDARLDEQPAVTPGASPITPGL